MDILDTLTPADSFVRRDGLRVERFSLDADTLRFYEPRYAHYVRILDASGPLVTYPYPTESVARESHEWHCWDRSHGRPVLQMGGR